MSRCRGGSTIICRCEMPSLKSIEIEYYRGFYNSREIQFALPNGEAGSGLTVIVGPNNAGKTSVLNALRLVLYPRQVDLEHRHANKILKISLTTSEGAIRSVSNPDMGANLVSLGSSAWPSLDDVRVVPSRRSWAPYTHQQTMEEGSYWQNAIHNMNEVQDAYLVSRVAALTSERREQFDSLLRRLVPQINTWRIELSRGQTFVLYTTHSGATHAADLFGDGMASLFRIAMALLDSSAERVVAIDEPELSLHPQAQKSLAEVLSDFSKERQIIITTHSPYFVNWSDIANGAVIFRLTQEKNGICVGALTAETLMHLQTLTNDWQKPNLLDAVAREIFFADEVVFFEGQEDVGLLKKYAQEKGWCPLPAFGYGAGGAGNIISFLGMAHDLGIPAVAVFDGDQRSMHQDAIRKFPDALSLLLPTPDMRDKSKRDANGRETEEINKIGIFDRRGVLKAEYEAYVEELFAKITSALLEHPSVEKGVL